MHVKPSFLYLFSNMVQRTLEYSESTCKIYFKIEKNIFIKEVRLQNKNKQYSTLWVCFAQMYLLKTYKIETYFDVHILRLQLKILVQIITIVKFEIISSVFWYMADIFIYTFIYLNSTYQ